VTLLEAVVALVILGVAGVASLGALQTASRGTHESEVWLEAVATAEAAMEASKLPLAAESALRAETAPGLPTSVARAPRPDLPGLVDVTVRVALPGGGEFVLRRLERAP
jgi:type II secretory pathway pseudopilin PulG